ncbi:unnamed protein product [Fraxinus pennsylvanica]|uniref:Glycosyl transferase family 3 N-terminal domain-containing protein n=1 Tax=Fraxinus pennsylvanica TaxID=56036 RepID=A0AAD1ZCJ9_9LAMI|nr:unnamed protein product [Fraxinus pennsylvanica]
MAVVNLHHLKFFPPHTRCSAFTRQLVSQKIRNSFLYSPVHINCSLFVPSALPNSKNHAPVSSFSQLIEGLINGVDLSEAEAEASLDFLLNGGDEALISAFLVLLRAKGETYEEILSLLPVVTSSSPSGPLRRMTFKMKTGSSFSCISTSLCSPFRSKAAPKMISRLQLFERQQCDTDQLRNVKVVKSCQLIERLSKRRCILFATADDQPYSELEPDDFEQEIQVPSAEDASPTNSSYFHVEGSEGKPGFISFYDCPRQKENEILVSTSGKNENSLLWFVGPTVLVASFVFPSLYLRKMLSTIFEDSLLTDFLILFFTEALFYCGVAVFLLLIDHLRRPIVPVSTDINLTPHLGHRISSVAVLVLSLTIPMVTMGFVWPWTGPAASATLAPYLVGLVVQFAFEQYTRYIMSPSWPAIPVIFQVYRFHQLNRAAQLVTALSFTVRGAKMTSQNLAINGSLSTLLNVLQFLSVISIWSLASFIVRYFPSPTSPER